MRILSFFDCMFTLLGLACSVAVASVVGLLPRLAEHQYYRDLDPTPRSIFETRRMGLG